MYRTLLLAATVASAAAPELPARLRTQVDDLLMAGRRAQAVLLVRRETGAPLLSAARAVDAAARSRVAHDGQARAGGA